MEESPSSKLPSLALTGSHGEWVTRRDLNAGGRDRGGETETMGLTKRQGRVSREKVKTTPGSLECLGETECRQKGGSTEEQKPHKAISIWMGNGCFILTLIVITVNR